MLSHQGEEVIGNHHSATAHDMNIKRLTLFSDNIKAQRHFYEDSLGLSTEETFEGFVVKVGNSKLNFIYSKNPYQYHYCFLIPCNQLKAATSWLKKRLDLIPIETGKYNVFFDSWNAESVYFYDGNGNIVEFIARFDLKNEIQVPFKSEHILCLNEIGMVSGDNISLFKKLNESFGVKKWRGSLDRFCAVGNQEGLLLLLNNKVKKTWFPTEAFPQRSPFIIEFKKGKVIYSFAFNGETFQILN